MAEQIEATVLKIGTQALLETPQDWSFPTKEIAMEEVVDGDINASISWQGTIYYVSETLADLITAANAGGGGGSSYLSYESYQNSAMSVAVDCFVWRDAALAIYKVYEPTRNNEVSRSQFAYADSIDKFPFDDVDWYDNNFNNVKLVSIATDAIINRCTLERMIINGNSHTGFQLIDTFFSGQNGYNTGTNGAEIYLTGNNVMIKVHATTEPGGINSYIDSPGNDCFIWGNTLVGGIVLLNSTTTSIIGCYLFFGKITVLNNSDIEENEIYESFITVDSSNLYDNTFRQSYTDITFTNCNDVNLNTFDGMGKYGGVPATDSTFTGVSGTMYRNRFMNGSSGTITACTNFSNNIVEVNGKIVNNGNEINKCTIGNSVIFSGSENKTNANFINIAGANYEMGEAAGAMTLTPV